MGNDVKQKESDGAKLPSDEKIDVDIIRGYYTAHYRRFLRIV